MGSWELLSSPLLLSDVTQAGINFILVTFSNFLLRFLTYLMYPVFSQKLAARRQRAVTLDKLQISLGLTVVGNIWDTVSTQLNKIHNIGLSNVGF